jgi:hypothetical protein
VQQRWRPAHSANIKIAHSLCNNSSYIYARAVRPDLPVIMPDYRHPADGEPRPGEPTIVVTLSQQVVIDAIFELASDGGWFPLQPANSGRRVAPGPPSSGS